MIPKTCRRSLVLTAPLIFAITTLFLARLALAEPGEIKVLLIGNSSYQDAALFPDLRGTPLRDTKAVEHALLLAGIPHKNIKNLSDLNYQSFFEAIHDFRQNLAPEDSAIFYFSGHGFSIDGDAFLVPKDFKLGRTKQNAREGSVSLDRIKRDLGKAQMRAIIIDACRTDIPLLKQATGSDTSLALTNLYDSKPAGTGELTVFASQGGKPAIADSPSEGLSYFTYFFVKRLELDLPDLGTVALQAQIATAISSEHRQEPDVRNNLQGYLQFPRYSAPLPKPTSQTAQQPSPPINYDSTLPLICPDNGQFAALWNLNGYSTLSTTSVPSSLMVGVESAPSLGIPMPVPVNPILRNKLQDASPIKLDGDMAKRGSAFIEEAVSRISPSSPLRGPNGPIEIKQVIGMITHVLTPYSDSVRVSYTNFAGSNSLGGSSTILAIKRLPPSDQDFVAALDNLVRESTDRACDALVKRITGSQ